MCLNKNYQAKAKVPDNYFKHIHSPFQPCDKRAHYGLFTPILHTNFPTKMAIKPKNEKVVFQVDLPENVYILG